jgi:hypothetical protein
MVVERIFLALDTLAIPATTTECERMFNSAKKLISPERNRLVDDKWGIGMP